MDPDPLPFELPHARLGLINEISAKLAGVRNVVGVVLGGSYARGTAKATSDLDFGIYYAEGSPFDIARIRELAEEISSPGAPPTVTELYEWGPWVNGGAWIATAQGKVDFLYRNIQQIERTIARASTGFYEHSYYQQPTFGFSSIVYLAETQYCMTLADPYSSIARLKTAVECYPEELRRKVITQSLWLAEFTLMHAQGFAEHGDILNSAGCVARVCYFLLHTLFALNRTYYFGDKGALEAVEMFAQKPADFVRRIRRIVSEPGDRPIKLIATIDLLRAVWLETRDLTGNQRRG
jgi:hypothetical protein